MTNEFLSIPTSIIFFIIDAIRGVMSAMAAMMAAKAIIDRTVMSMMAYLCFVFTKRILAGHSFSDTARTLVII